MKLLRKKDGSICFVKLIIMAAVVSIVFTIGGTLIGKLLEKE